ncbi:MAG: DUF309 domain-containing protein [Caldilineaceae bacterium]
MGDRLTAVEGLPILTPEEIQQQPRLVVSLEPDLMVATRLEDVIQTQGGRAITVATPELFVTAVDRYFPLLALIDLSTPGDWQQAIRRCKLRPETRQIPLYAFGSHVDVETLQAARAAGADQVWPRSKFMAEVVAVVDQHLHPPVEYPDGWDDELSDLAHQGLLEFNRGDYFEQHEQLEAAWLAETRPIREMYQGILQIGVAFLLIQRNNWSGAIKLFRRGLPRLRRLPAQCQGINIGALRTAAENIHAELTALGPARLHEFDQSRLPKIEFTPA